MTAHNRGDTFTWSTQDREEIESAVPKLDSAEREKLLCDLELIVIRWRRVFGSRDYPPSPAEHRNYGRRVSKAAATLVTLLESPPGDCDSILEGIYIAPGRASKVVVRAPLRELSLCLKDLQRSADLLGNISVRRGAPRRDELRRPIREIAKVFIKYTKKKRTGTTREGPFYRVVQTCVRAMGYPTEDLYPHIKSAMTVPVE